MAFHIGRTVAVAAEPWERALAEGAVSRLNGSFAAPDKPQVVEDLLARLQQERTSRDPAGNHFRPEHARQVVEDLLAEVLAQSKRRRELDAFFRSVHDKAVAIARKALDREDEAQDAVAATYAKVLAGKTQPRHFFRALKQTIIDRLRSRGREQALFTQPKEVTPKPLSLSEVAWGPDGVDTITNDPASARLDDQDPLDLLVMREEQEGRRRMLAAAKKDPRWRYIKLRAWAAPLREECAESTPSNA